MDANEKAARARPRGDWPVRRFTLGDEPSGDFRDLLLEFTDEGVE
jgi:hypothetical protein